FIGMADDNTLGLFGNTGASPNWGLTMNTATLDITLGSDLYIRTTGGGFARFTKQTFDRLGEPLNYLKLVMPSSTDSPFIFAIGYTSVVGSITSFVNQFSLNQNGNLTIRGSLTAGGGKGGFVVENFINSVGDTLEQGDVVIVGGHEVDRYYGVGNSIPVPEVDLTDQAYDTRVCGIVDTVVRADSLPPHEMRIPTEDEVQAAQAEKNVRRRKAAEKALADRLVNPLAE